MCICSKSGRNR